eukprot:CCRYP_017486-RA/>CCRYP_017486-RA protein AED:0.05 eAED:0.05 QI:89/0/0/1/0/0/2/0/60
MLGSPCRWEVDSPTWGPENAPFRFCTQGGTKMADSWPMSATPLDLNARFLFFRILICNKA